MKGLKKLVEAAEALREQCEEAGAGIVQVALTWDDKPEMRVAVAFGRSADQLASAVNETCSCYDGVILGQNYDTDPNDVTVCPKCQLTQDDVEVMALLDESESGEG